MCLLANRIFVLSSQKLLGIKLQTANTLFEKTPLTRRLLSRGAVCANAHAYAMAFLVRPGAIGSPQLRKKKSGTSIKIEMKGIGMVNQQKGVQQGTAYSVVVVNDHMYPRPYIIFDPKGS